MTHNKRWLKKCMLALGCFATTVTAGIFAVAKTDPITTSAASYRTGTNSVSSSYKSGRYYDYFKSITLTGDGVTDTLALAMSQLGYQEGDSESSLSGEVGGSSNYTEFYYNFGQVTPTLSAEWCAAFCSWALYQSQVTDQGSYSDWCRNHMGDSKYIWKEVSCYYWSEQLMDLGYYGYRGNYTPKSGDLIFFNRSGEIGHIGLVVWCSSSTVYTIEGNTSSGSGVDGNGGGVYYKSYSLSDSGIHGYGKLPYPTKSSAPKVDYSGKNRTAGQYMTKSSLSVSSSAGGSTSFTIPQYRMFKVTGFSGSYAKVEYDGKTGYATLSSSTLQITALEAEASIAVKSSATKSTFFAGGTDIPEGYQDNANVLITGLSKKLKNYCGLEDYGNNKDLVLINGRSWRKWESRPGEKIGNIWIRGKDSTSCYLGFDFNGNTKLRLSTQNGVGEAVDTIVLRRGFQFVNTTSSQWDKDDVIYEGSSVVSGVVGTLTNNIILQAKKGGGFNILSDTEEVEVKSEYQYGIVTGDVVNVRSGASTDYEIYGQVTYGTQLTYLGKKSNGWCKVSYDGKTAWISGDYFEIQGYETTVEQKPITLSGYTIEFARTVTITGNVYVSKTASVPDDVNTDAWGVALVGESYQYLNKKTDRWYKVNFKGNIGWISENYSTLSDDENVEITPLNKDWPEDVTPRSYDIIKVAVYAGASSAKQVTFYFSDVEKISKSTVHLGYTDWSGMDNDTKAFMKYIKINGVPVLTAFPSATLEGLDQRSGLSLKNVELAVDDVVTVDKGATFEHNGVSMTMQSTFGLTWNGENYVSSIIEETEDSSSGVDGSADSSVDSSSDDVGSGETSSENGNVEDSLYMYDYQITDGYFYFSSNTNLIFKFESETDTVDLGYTDWVDPDDSSNAFKKYIKLNGKPLAENARLQGLDRVDGLSLCNISLNAGDTITIVKDAVFIHDDIRMTLMVSLSYTWDGEQYVVEIGDIADDGFSEDSSEEDSSEDVSSESTSEDVSSESTEDDSFVSSSEEISDEESSEDFSEDVSSEEKASSEEEILIIDCNGCGASFNGAMALLCVAGLGLFIALNKKREV